MVQFSDRREAGDALARKLEHYRNYPEAIVLGLPRGGVPVAYEVANELNLPLDVFLVRKLGTPGHEEYAMGAIASGGIRVMNPHVKDMKISRVDIERIAEREEKELRRQEMFYRGNRPPALLAKQVVIIVDDGLATGSSMRAAATAVKQQNPARIVVAVPVGSAETCEELRSEVDEVVCVLTPEPFRAVALWYEDFKQTTDDAVNALMTAAWASQDARST